MKLCDSRVAFLGVMAICLLFAFQPATAQLQDYEGSRLGTEEYEELAAGRGARQMREMFPAYRLGLLTAIESFSLDQREHGRKQTFCVPENAIFSVVDLQETIAAELHGFSQHWQDRRTTPVALVAVTGYRRRFPCPAVLPTDPAIASLQSDRLTVGEFARHMERLGRFIYSEPRRVLTGFTIGLRDGIEAMQFGADAVICLPFDGSEFVSDAIVAIDRELRSRRDYWADRQDTSVGEPAMIALKKLYPCKR